LGADSVPVIVGPTAAGKSAVAMWLAAGDVPVTIVSADSRQVYRGFDVGTAKPSRADRDAVPHACIDVADPRARFSAYLWADLAAAAIEDARRDGRVPLVVGGTGLYLRTLFEAGFTEPELDPSRRAALAEVLAPLPTAELRRWCEQLDPPRAVLGRVQLLRSIEIALLSGERLSDLHATRRRAPRWKARYLAVDPGPALAQHIERRAGAMLDGAWQEEVARLIGEVPPDAPAWKASGYGAVRRLVEGGASLAGTRERVIIETRQYAKRQRTWFRNQLPAGSVTALDPARDDWQATARRWWDESMEADQA
jgi:tRNA dimethylallyltransferase